MSRWKHTLKPSEYIYVYDGALCGLYSAIYACFYNDEMPVAIYTEQGLQPSLFPERHIPPNREQANRVRNSIRERISPRALELIETVYYSCLPEKELCILRFLLLGYKVGKPAAELKGHALVHPLLKAEKHLWGEQHLLLGFIRFQDYGGMLAATITPKNFVLPFLEGHFTDRFSCENFLIYDKRHGAALLHENGKSGIFPLEQAQFQAPPPEELRYQALWKQFYNTIAIEARQNLKCRRTHMPMRYWENMVEMQDQYLPPFSSSTAALPSNMPST